MEKSVLERGVEIAGGQSAFARMVGTSQQRVRYMLVHGKQLPGEFVLSAERGTGIPRGEWRPDVYPPTPADAPSREEAA